MDSGEGYISRSSGLLQHDRLNDRPFEITGSRPNVSWRRLSCQILESQSPAKVPFDFCFFTLSSCRYCCSHSGLAPQHCLLQAWFGDLTAGPLALLHNHTKDEH